MWETAKDLGGGGGGGKVEQWKINGYILGAHKDLSRILFINNET